MRRLHSIMAGFIFVVLVLAGGSIHPLTAAAEARMKPRIMVLNSYHKGMAWTDTQNAGITDALMKSGLEPVIYTEYADWKRFPTALNRDNLYNSLLYKYSGINFDLVLATDDFALEFVLDKRTHLFNNAPVVFSGVNSTGAQILLKDQPNVTGVLEKVDPTETVKAARYITPTIKNIYVLYDHSESGLTTGQIVEEKVRLLDPELKIIHLDQMPFAKVLQTVSKLDPARDMVLMTTYFGDADGNVMEFDTASQLLGKMSTVPVYHLYDFGLNHNAFGGSMISGATQGMEAAKLALRILNGESASSIPLVDDASNRLVFDNGLLERFQVAKSQLPPGSEIINKPFSFYETYRTMVLGVLAAFAVLTGFIVILLFYIRQIRGMRRELSAKNEALTQLNEELEASDEELRQQFDELSGVKESLAISEARFRLAAYGSDAVVWDMDLTHDTLFVSDRWYEFLGYERHELNILNGGWKALIHPDDTLEADKQREAHMRGETPYYNTQYRMRAKSGEYVWFQVRGKISPDPYTRTRRFAGSMIDITESKEYAFKLQDSYQELEATYEELTALQEELKEQFDKLADNQERLVRSEERYRLITEAANDGIWEIDYGTGDSFYSQRWLELLKLPAEQASSGFSIRELVHPEDAAAYEQAVEEHRSGLRESYQCEYRLRLGTGEYRWFLGKGKGLFDGSGNVCRMAGSDTDIHALKESQARLHELAYFDPLSGLPNKLSLTVDLPLFFQSGGNQSGALLFLDVDNFKYINDTMGHSFGDCLLRLVSRRLIDLSGNNASFYRLGGDEFVILLKNNPSELAAAQYAETLLQGLEEPFKIGDSSVHISASIGIASYPKDGSTAEELLKNADVAMYKAKEKGKGNFVLYGSEMQKPFMERMEIEKHLRNALPNGELELYYQPQYHIDTGKITGFEALIRWNSSELGYVSPLSFIGIAEDCQLILPIGTWVLRQACTFIRTVHKLGFADCRISVNISIVQLIQDNFIATVLLALDETGLAAEYLEIEITESIFMESYETIVEKLELLKSLGIHIALDDFGTGYSSLSYLKELPITTLKVDKTFIDDVPEQPGGRSLASSIIMIGHRMGLEVVAEGVEKEEQLAYLRNWECDKIQGYFISKPLREQDVAGWLLQYGQLSGLAD